MGKYYKWKWRQQLKNEQKNEPVRLQHSLLTGHFFYGSIFIRSYLPRLSQRTGQIPLALRSTWTQRQLGLQAEAGVGFKLSSVMTRPDCTDHKPFYSHILAILSDNNVFLARWLGLNTPFG